jgi:hypothetical protein
MPNWKFWEPQKSNPQSVADPAPSRFTIKPRTDIARPNKSLDAEAAEKLARLHRRREAVMFDVEQSELAASPDNPWLQRVGLIDEALAAVRLDRERTNAMHIPPGRSVQPVPIVDLQIDLGPPPKLGFRIEGEQFAFEEDLDWAERGHQLARSELQQQSGDVLNVLPAAEMSDEQLVEHLTRSLFVLASDLRDRAIAGETLPESITLADLARPDEVNGGWLDWNGHSAVGAEKQAKLREIESEEQRLLAERARDIEDMEKLADRLPIALRRLADVDAEIAALGVQR